MDAWQEARAFLFPEGIPEFLAWKHYVKAQVSSALLGSIPDETIACAVEIDRESVTLHFLMQSVDEAALEAIEGIHSGLFVLLEGQVEVQHAVDVDNGEGWPANDWWPVYRARFTPEGSAGPSSTDQRDAT